MTTPNIYEYATAELSQDATIAYILSWAKSEHRNKYPTMNNLGERLLRELVRSSAEAQGIDDPLAETQIEHLMVDTQVEHIDICVKVNDDICLPIEDKTKTCERPGQMAGHVEKLNGGKVQVMPVYLKTGNESRVRERVKSGYGVFLRSDLLRVLNEFRNTGNAIVDEFRHHLQRLEDETNSFRDKASKEWTTQAKQGYYMALANWLSGLQEKADHNWKYISNPRGGFFGFEWNWRELPSHRCTLYLQIQDADRLLIRVGKARNDSGEHVKTSPDLLRGVLKVIRAAAEQDRFRQVRVRKVGHYRGGEYSAVADLDWGDGPGDTSYLATESSGRLDWERTKQRIRLAMDLVDATCAQGQDESA